MTTEQTQTQPETRPSEVRSDALLGCPFCGTTDVQMRTSKVVFWVQCNNTECFCSMGGERTEEDAVKAWNRRQPNSLLDRNQTPPSGEEQG